MGFAGIHFLVCSALEIPVELPEQNGWREEMGTLTWCKKQGVGDCTNWSAVVELLRHEKICEEPFT